MKASSEAIGIVHELWRKYWGDKNAQLHQRFGQFVCNYLKITNQSLFSEIDNNKAFTMACLVVTKQLEESDTDQITPKMVLNIIYSALRTASDMRINDVTMDMGADNQDQLVLTTQDVHDRKSCWIVDEKSILMTDDPNDDEE